MSNTEKIKLPHGASFIIDRLFANGKEAFIVGGCVRDMIRGVAPNDYDITTSAFPEEMQTIFSDMKTVEIGIRHGTVAVLVDGELYEVTTYRIDGEYTDSRHPDTVTFSRNLSDDLSRRDFTMNAIAYNDELGFVDLFFGKEDIENKIIRCVGDPMKRFTEDALRIIRALRFSATLGFEIEENTERAIFECAHLLKNVSRERIFAEWKKLVSGKCAYSVINKYRDVIAPLLSLDKSKLFLIDKALFDKAGENARELSLYAGLESPSEKYREAMCELRSDSKRIKLGSFALSALSISTSTEIDIKKLLSKHSEEEVSLLAELKISLSLEDSSLRERLASVLSSGDAYTLKQLKITGRDISDLGFKGALVGEVLDEVLSLVIEGSLLNEREALLSYVKGKTK